MDNSDFDSDGSAVFIALGGALGVPFGPIGILVGHLGGTALHKWLNS